MPSHRARLSVEHLEDRRLLSVTVTPPDADRTLTIQGDPIADIADTVTVSKQGSKIIVMSSSDDGTSASQEFAVRDVKRIVFNGGEGDDVFTNLTTIRSIVHGDGGDDVLTGGKGKDEIHGDDGSDVISGGKGRDVLFGDAGNDQLKGGQANDRLFGGDDDDDLDGGQGRDLLDGENGNDTIHNRREDKVIVGEGDIFDLPPKTKGGRGNGKPV